MIDICRDVYYRNIILKIKTSLKYIYQRRSNTIILKVNESLWIFIFQRLKASFYSIHSWKFRVVNINLITKKPDEMLMPTVKLQNVFWQLKVNLERWIYVFKKKACQLRPSSLQQRSMSSLNMIDFATVKYHVVIRRKVLKWHWNIRVIYLIFQNKVLLQWPDNEIFFKIIFKNKWLIKGLVWRLI